MFLCFSVLVFELFEVFIWYLQLYFIMCNYFIDCSINLNNDKSKQCETYFFKIEKKYLINLNDKNMSTELMIEVYYPGNYTCNLIPLIFSKIKARHTEKSRYKEDLYAIYDDDIILYRKQMYLVEDLIVKKWYWLELNIVNITDAYVYFNVVSKIDINNGNCVTVTLDKNRPIIIYYSNCDKYSIYKPSVYFGNIPSSYKIIIPNHKKKWYELCKIVDDNNILVPISKVINIDDLKYYISEFL